MALDLTIAYFCGITVVLLGLAPIVLELIHKRFDFFNLKNIFIIYYVVQLGLSGLLTLISGDAPDLAPDPTYYASQYSSAFILAVAGIAAFHLGYYFWSPRVIRLPRWANWQWSTPRIYSALVISLVLSAVGFQLLLNEYGGLSGFLVEVERFRASGMVGRGIFFFPATGLLGLAVLCYFANRIQRNPQGNTPILAIGLVLCAMIPGALTGFRGLMLPVVLQFLVVWHYFWRPIRLVWISTALFLVFSLATVYGIYRTAPKDVGVWTGIKEAVEEKPDLIYGLFNRSSGTEVLAMVVARLGQTHEYRYFWPAVVEALTILIPHAIWDTKPVPLSVQFGTYFFLDDLNYYRKWSLDRAGGISPTIVGELYWHGGIIAVLLGLFLYGHLARRVYHTLQAYKSNAIVVILYSVFFVRYVLSAEALQGNINAMVIYFVAFIIIHFYCSIGVRAHRPGG